jgi:hypothetical protein
MNALLDDQTCCRLCHQQWRPDLICRSVLSPTISAATDTAIRKALKKRDIGIRKIATALGVGTGTVQRIKAQMSA